MIGPTASGKTSLAAQIACELDGEVISADSRQVYKGLDIGTGKDLEQYEVNGKKIPYHLIGIADPRHQYFLHDFIADLRKSFDDIVSRGKLPVICGGTGLYLDALRKNFEVTQVPENAVLRKSLEGLAKEDLLGRLYSYPEKQIAQVDKTSEKRILRGIEVAEFLAKNKIKAVEAVPYKPYYVGIQPSKEKIAERIRIRLDHRLQQGLVEEVRNLLASGVSYERLETLGLEYKFVSLYLKGELTPDEMRDRLFTAIRQFSKRQMTWFRKMEKEGVEIRWIQDPVDVGGIISELKKMF